MSRVPGIRKKNSDDFDLLKCDFDALEDYIREEISTYSNAQSMNLFKRALSKGHIKLIKIILDQLKNTATQKEISTIQDYFDNIHEDIDIDVDDVDIDINIGSESSSGSDEDSSDEIDRHIENIEHIVESIRDLLEDFLNNYKKKDKSNFRKVR